MSLRKFSIFFTLFISFSLITAPAFSQSNEKLKTKVTNFLFSENENDYIFQINTDKAITYTSYTAETPWRLVLEFPLTDFGKFLGENEINKGTVKSYVIKHIGSSSNQIGRLEIMFSSKPDFYIEKQQKSLSISIKKASKSDIAKQDTPSSDFKEEIITINNLLYSGELSKFVIILETSGKPEFLSYILKNPLRIVFDISNSKYMAKENVLTTTGNIVKSIRVESYPTLSRVFLDLATVTVPSFLAKAEADKLIIELTTEEFKEQPKSIKVLDAVDFIPNNGKAIFRFKGIGDKDYKVYKLKEDMLVFDFFGININKGIQKTYDTKDVSEIIKSFTLYQVKPEEDNRVRFVVDLKSVFPYKTVKSNGDIVIEFYKEKAVTKDVKATVESKPATAIAAPVAPKVTATMEKKEVPLIEEDKKVEEPKKEEVVAKKEAVIEEKIDKASEKKPEKIEVKSEEKVVTTTAKEEPKFEPKPEPKAEQKVEKKTESVTPVSTKAETTSAVKEKKEKPVVITIKPKEEEKEATDKTAVSKDAVVSQYKGRPITINLKDAEIQHIFKLVAEVAKLDGKILNIVTSDDVRGKVSIQLEEVPWDQVLDVIMEVNNLGMKQIGNIIRVMPKEKLKKEQEDLIAASKIKEKLGNLVLEIVPINYADAADFESKVKPLLSQRGSVTLDKRNNSLIINDLKENIDEVKKLIAKLDTPPQQVIIEARVVEASSDFSKEMGIQWGAKFFKDFNSRYRAGMSGASSRPDIAGTATFPSGVGGGAAIDFTGTAASPIPYFVNLPAATGQGAGGGINFALVNLRSGVGLDIQLTAMENKGVGKILSRPRITTLNNVEANIQQGSSIPYETLSDKGTQTQFIDANLQLTVTPRITPDNSIILKVKVSNNNPNTALRSAGGVPSIDKNEASTEILVRDGQTIVIGGIIRNKEGQIKSGIPFLMDIPVIGWLFKKESKTVENRELLIFLTPNIIKGIIETEAS